MDGTTECVQLSRSRLSCASLDREAGGWQQPDSILYMLTDTIDCCGYIEVFEILAISYLCISIIKLNTLCMCMYIHIHRFDGARGVGGRQV